MQFISNIGGQAVLHGLLMRNRTIISLAIRNEKNEIIVEKRSWYSLYESKILSKSFIRGFPILVETLINGVLAINRSVALAENNTKKETIFQTIFELILSIFGAIFLFILMPHILSLVMYCIGLSGNINNLTFHIWDGIFKILLFISYILLISNNKEIKEVFQYHGAEHKVISCYESGMLVSAKNAKLCTRLHPRCGTSFVLFILLLALFIHSILVPLFLFFPLFKNNVTLHLVVILFKILLIIPISAIAYELIRKSTKPHKNFFMKILLQMGLVMQLLSTKEPTLEQLEVAVIALKVAVGENTQTIFETATYTVLDE